MDARFREYADSLPQSFERLTAMAPITIETLPRKIPDACVYLFSEGGHNLYVGRTNHFRQRLRNHSAPSARENQAVFAFKLAQEFVGRPRRGTRRAALEDPEFAQAFRESKRRITKMELRFIPETNQIRQTLLEIYVALVLSTPYNDFETH